ncbi:MAG: hypothetical protein NXI24_10735 [bacterium]|nr:hypothetical protein [bacterium]
MIRKTAFTQRPGAIVLLLLGAFVFLFTDAAIHGFPQDDTTVHHSGSQENPELESALGPDLQEYSPALATSNSILDQIKKNEIEILYDKSFSDRLKEEFNKDWYLFQIEKLINFTGPLETYQANQWSFTNEIRQGVRYIHCTKYAEHKYATVRYTLSFVEHDLKRIIKFSWFILSVGGRNNPEEFVSGSQVHSMPTKPLTEEVEAYGPLLEAANHMLALMQKKEYAKVHDTYFADILKKEMNVGGLQKTHAKVVELAGDIQHFEELQWRFIVKKYSGRAMVTVLKIVQHEHALVFYHFTTYYDNRKRIAGFRMYPLLSATSAKYSRNAEEYNTENVPKDAAE